MHPLRLLLAVTAIALPVLAAPPLELHRGSTREWVRYTGTGPDSVRYRLEFLDSTRRDTTTFKATDWRVRVTIPDSPRVVDTAILRVMHESIPLDRFPGNLAYWLKPSMHCPVDVQWNPLPEVKTFHGGSLNWLSVPYLVNGMWEIALSKGQMGMRSSLRVSDLGIVSTSSLSDNFAIMLPLTTGMDNIGLTGSLQLGSYWKLMAADGKPQTVPQGGLGHRLKSGECWVYRDSSGNPYYPNTIQKSYVSLELLAPPSDSTGWTRLSVRKSVHPDSGASRDTTIAIRIDTTHHIVRIGEKITTPWLLPSTMEAHWAIGLLKHLILRDSAKSRYAFTNSSKQGEVPSTGSSIEMRMLLSDSIGATSITSSSSSWGVMVYNNYSSWTLTAHSFDNTILSASPRTPQSARNLAWLRDRIAQNPALEIIRIAPDGSNTHARGTEALRLLDTRGVGFIQISDGQEQVTLRVVHP